MRIILCSTLALLLGVGTVVAFPTEEVPTSEAEYMAKVKTGAPEQIVSKATIIMMQEGKPKSLQTGANGFTCLIDDHGTPLCADENGMAWAKAIQSKSEPPNKVGFIYMLAGDTGTSNHDAYQRSISIGCRPAHM
jgi:hypothetical protein